MNLEKTLIARSDLPLYGKRILYCTPRNYAQKMARLLVLRGARPVWMPTIVIEPMDDYSEFDEAIRNLGKYRWLSFTSRNGIEAFFDRLDALGLDHRILENVMVSALGNDSKALEERGIRADLLPTETSGAGVIAELKQRGENSGRILLPVPEVYGMEEPPVIPDYVSGLLDLGMDVHRVPAYATRRVTEGLEHELRMIVDGELDMIAFTSVAELDSLLYMLGDSSDVLAKHTIASYGESVVKSARGKNLHSHIVSENYSAFEYFLEAMEEYFTR